MSADPLLAVEGLSVARDGRRVVEGVTFSAHAGDLVAVVGPNGAGKSTLFAALLRLLPASGRVVAAGPFGYVPQHQPSQAGFPVTALDVALMGAYRRVGPFRRLGRDDRREALAALARVGMEGLARRPFSALSGGQRQRVLLARALLQRGAVLLLDEPLAGVDAVSEDAIFSALEQERTEGRAVLIATHDLVFARERCSHALLLNARVHAFGPPAQALTGATLRSAYGERLVVLDERGGLGAIDEGSHHDHDHGHGHAEGHDGHGHAH